MGGEQSPWIVLYDGECGLCRWLLAALLRRDSSRRLRPLALQRPEAEVLLSDLSAAERMSSWHLVSPSGARLSGGAALPPLLRQLDGGSAPAAALERVPRLTAGAYRWVADHRSGLSRLVPQESKRRAGRYVSEREAEATRRS